MAGADMPYIDAAMMREHLHDAIILMGGERSRYAQATRANMSKDAMMDAMGLLVDIVGQDQFFVEIIAQHYTPDNGIQSLNTSLIDLADTLGV
jgi:DNA polymerase III alpha subunit